MFFIEVFSKTEKNALIQQIFLNGCGCTQLPAVAQSMGAGVDIPLQNPTGHHCSVNGGGKGLALGNSYHQFSSALNSFYILNHKAPLKLHFQPCVTLYSGQFTKEKNLPCSKLLSRCEERTPHISLHC